jgi:hypothetical protein
MTEYYVVSLASGVETLQPTLYPSKLAAVRALCAMLPEQRWMLPVVERVERPGCKAWSFGKLMGKPWGGLHVQVAYITQVVLPAPDAEAATTEAAEEAAEAAQEDGGSSEGSSSEASPPAAAAAAAAEPPVEPSGQRDVEPKPEPADVEATEPPCPKRARLSETV